MQRVSESERRTYLVLWKYEEAERLKGQVVTRGVGTHMRGLKLGDRIFVWATQDGELFVLGAIEVERSGTRNSKPWAEGKSLYGPFQITPLKSLKGRLRFRKSKSEQLSLNESTIAMQVRSRRQPTPATVKLLDKVLSRNRRASLSRGTPRKWLAKKPFTVKAVMSALLEIQPKMSEAQRSMLREHYLNRSLSMERIAKAGGYNYYGSANLQYGKLWTAIARELDYKPRGGKTYTFSTGSGLDENGHFQWRMDDVLVKALDRLGWFGEEPVGKSTGASNSSDIEHTESEAIRLARRGQGKFRTGVLSLWKTCSVTGCSRSRLLVASHIVSWVDCETGKERLDKFNGLLLTPNLDKLFDKCLISFDNNGKMLLSKEVQEWKTSEKVKLGVSGKMELRFVPPQAIKYLERHRERFKKKTKETER